MGINASENDVGITHEPSPGNLVLEENVSANEFLLLQGGQFSTSRRHAVWLPSYLEQYDPDALRYYLSINMPEIHDTDFRWDEFVNRVNNELIGTYGNFVHRVMTLTHRLPSDGGNPLGKFDVTLNHINLIGEVESLMSDAIESMEKQRFKEALRTIMGIAQLGNALLQEAAPWKFIGAEDSEERSRSLSSLAMSWRLCKCLAVAMRPFVPFSSDRLWAMMGENSNIDEVLWDDSMDATSNLNWNPENPSPLFSRLDLDEILSKETSLVVDRKDNDAKTPPETGGDYIQFDDFLKVQMRTGKVISVEDHPNADQLYIITIEDEPGSSRTLCAGLKGMYQPSDLEGLNVVFVANLEPRKLRGVLSEGMLLAADDGDGNVRVLTLDGDIRSGSVVR